MPAILTIDYDYLPTNQPWFTKRFNDYAELSKWLREDSIIVLDNLKLEDEVLKKQLILSKLALPKVRIIVLAEDYDQVESAFFTFTSWHKLEEIIAQAIINPHEMEDNRKNLEEIIKLFT